MNWKDLSIRDKAAYIRRSVSDGIYNLEEIRNRFDKGGNIFSGEDKNQPTQQMQMWGEFGWSPQKEEQTLAEKVSKPAPYLKPDTYSDGTPVGVVDVTNFVNSGLGQLYNKDLFDNVYDFYEDTDGNVLRIQRNDLGSFKRDLINTDGLTKLNWEEFRKRLPKRDYIGGTPDESRVKAIKKVPGLTQEIYKRAKSYNIDPNLLLRRMSKEGIVDNWLYQYNSLIDSVDQKDFWSDNLMNQEVAGYGSMGLDDAGQRLLDGKYTLKDTTARWGIDDWNPSNEKGRTLYNVPIAENLPSALEIMAADMAYTGDVLRSRGFNDNLNTYINAAYNMGMNHNKLNDSAFVKRVYSYPDYFGLYNLKTK